MTMFDDIVTYLKELFSGWWILLGTIETLLFAASALTAVFRPDLILPSAGLLIVFCVLLIPAGFRIWRQKHHRVKELESKDADIQLIPLPGEELIGITVPEDYRLVLNLVPHRIAVWVSFNLVNYGETVGFLDDIHVETDEWPDTAFMSFRGEGLFPCYESADGATRPIKVGEPVDPQHKPRRVSYLVNCSVDTETQTPERFAEQLRRLTDVDVDFVWSFTGRYGKKEPRHIEVTVPVTRIRELMCSHWEVEPRAEELKDTLIKIARTPIGTLHSD